jgi:hypothetical protein
MNFNEENQYTPSPNLLPFGGFEVATLLLKLQRGENKIGDDQDLLDFQPMTRDVSSGWLRSKILAG